MRILVTGASGFVGGRAVQRLRAAGHQVIPSGRRPARELRAPLDGYVQWDLTREARTWSDLDAVVHCAAHVGDSGDTAAFDATNISGMRTLLASLPEGARVVHVSSASVYDFTAPLVNVAEDAPYPTQFLNPYARTKVEAERIVRGSGRSFVILRPHIIYGPGDTHLMPGLKRALRFGWLPAYGDGMNQLSVTHVDNLADAIALAVAPEAPTGVYNVTDSVHAPVDETLRTLLARAGIASRVAYIPRGIAWPLAVLADALPALLRGRGDRTISRFLVCQMTQEFTLDIGKARAELGYSPRWSFRDGPLE